ncbi:PadR family transcriptional regulator [Bacillus aquiflavi]|uniref:PadR family transcriptional regulator n=1 Tax=Bacillus aquiflavi TaxID=2672567 RepID=UPI001CA96596|nr:PadR family transcriptional regulator [Bacillus aquiflavi]UAC48441.1 PadR family transcriptional regulator [Bacillus aquiflavi]
MSVKHAILGLLYQKPRHGYEIKTEFDKLVYNKWSLNTGQVYTTLDRMMRDLLVEPIGEDEKDRKQYKITEAGIKELQTWLLKPVKHSLLKDEFYFKILCARRIHFHEVKEMIKQQRQLIVKEILMLTQFKNELDENTDKDMLWLIEGGLLHLDADLRWLEMLD